MSNVISAVDVVASYGVESITDRISKEVEELQKVDDKLETELVRLNEELECQVTKLTNRLEEIQRLNEKVDEARTRKHALEIRLVKNQYRVAMKMFIHSLIINIIMTIVVFGFTCILYKVNDKYLKISNNYDELSLKYNELIEEYEEIDKEINDYIDTILQSPIPDDKES